MVGGSAAGWPGRAGSRFGHYLLRRLLGRGGFGEVYEAEDTVMDRVVALKLMAPAYSGNSVFRQRLYREARTAGRLHEPHVVPIHHCGEIDGQLFIDMRLIEGTDLQAVLAADGPLEPARAVAIVRQIASALDAAHGAQVIHRDIKPANILLTGEDFACLVDFGLANAATDAKLTSSGTTIGTFAYMAPERLGNTEVDHRADVYALTCVLYECLTGFPPYASGDLPALITAHLSAPIPRPSEARPQVPAGFDDVIARGMAKNPQDRYDSAGELARAAHHALTAVGQDHADTILASTEAAAAGEPTQAARPVKPPARRKNRVATAAGVVGVVVALLIIGAMALLVHDNAGPPPTTTTPATTTTSMTTPTTAPPVAAEALQGLWLSPEQINSAVGSTKMTVAATSAAMNDASAQVADKACLPAQGPAQATVYEGSGWSTVREQGLHEPGNFSHFVLQALVLFPSAHDADAFFASSAQRWPACSDRRYTVTQPGVPDTEWTVGPVSSSNGTLSVTKTGRAAGATVTCQRALTVANNVAVDVGVCSNNLSDAQSNSAVNVARQIAAKVAA
ncbi:serine/threonine-protein kinase PknH/PknJ [Mycobacterium sp. IS-1264]|uniref:serine/threonine-protein kinase PknH/PknJ n=1 Tax=Mycobacterium sp. IS-1264 TaxID=1834158 RepID=UPI00096CBC0C|nr:serine/threonine-protein kinase PknH/PknJ [Mycobacterium sp. IS-1264]OMC42570.1 hypothetical protein A5744_16595 [Mycobacterium sp. IS-1264]